MVTRFSCKIQHRRQFCPWVSAPKPQVQTPQLVRSSVVGPSSHYKFPPLKRCLFVLPSLGTVGGLAALCLIGFALFFIRTGRHLKIPRIRKASGPMSLFDPQEGRLDPDVDAVAVRRPLLYVRSPSLFPCEVSYGGDCVPRILRTLLRFRRSTRNWSDPCALVVGCRRNYNHEPYRPPQL